MEGYWEPLCDLTSDSCHECCQLHLRKSPSRVSGTVDGGPSYCPQADPQMSGELHQKLLHLLLGSCGASDDSSIWSVVKSYHNWWNRQHRVDWSAGCDTRPHCLHRAVFGRDCGQLTSLSAIQSVQRHLDFVSLFFNFNFIDSYLVKFKI